MSLIIKSINLPVLEVTTRSQGEECVVLPISTSSSGVSAVVDINGLDPGSEITIWFMDPGEDKGEASVSLKSSSSSRSRRGKWEELRQDGVSGRYRVHRRMGGDSQTILIYKVPETSDFLGTIPDHRSLSDICLPGTHESCAMYGFPVSQCQQPSTPISQQLIDGIRFFDVRLRVVGEELLMYHGPRPQRSSLKILLQTLHSFLDAHPTETIILLLKEEDASNERFSELVYETFKPFLEKRWFLENRIPTLGEVRGRGILMTRFNRSAEGEWAGGMGIHPYTWPDSRREGFVWDCAGTPFRIQDWYRINTFLQIPEKFEAIVQHLVPTLEPLTDARVPFTLSYTSASGFPLSLPTTMAKGFGWPAWGLGVAGINSRFLTYLLDCIAHGKRIRGCIAMDFYRQCGDSRGLAEILVAMNSMGSDD